MEHLRQNPFDNAVVAANRTQFPLSVRVAQRRIRLSEIRSRIAAPKPFLKQCHKNQRVGFALQYLPENLNFWKNVIFSDEKVFQSCSNGRIRVYRPIRSRYNERYTRKIEHSGRFSVNVWVWISAAGPGVFWNIVGTLNTDKYLQTLERREQFEDFQKTILCFSKTTVQSTLQEGSENG